MHAWKVSRGFTLLELLAVILIMALGISLLSFSVNRGLNSVKDRQAGRDLTLVLRAARNAAIAQGQAVVVSFDLAAHTYKAQAVGQAEHRLPDGMQMRVTTAADLVPNEAVIAFYPAGNSSGGNVYLTRNGLSWRVDVPWLTGVATWRELTVQ